MPQLFWPLLPSQSLLWPNVPLCCCLTLCQQDSGPMPSNTLPISYFGDRRGGLLIAFVTTNSEPSGQQFGKLYTHLKNVSCIRDFAFGPSKRNLWAILEELGFLTTLSGRGASWTPDICQWLPPTEGEGIKEQSVKNVYTGSMEWKPWHKL